jgi:hypothetical protein
MCLVQVFGPIDHVNNGLIDAPLVSGCLLACLRLRWILAEPKNCVYPGLAELRKCLQTLVKKHLALR